MSKSRTHYDNLQIAEHASAEVIRAAYKFLSQKWHPDKHPNDREKAERIMKMINHAYRVLSNPEMRREHDAWIAKERSGAADERRRESRGPTETPEAQGRTYGAQETRKQTKERTEEEPKYKPDANWSTPRPSSTSSQARQQRREEIMSRYEPLLKAKKPSSKGAVFIRNFIGIYIVISIPAALVVSLVTGSEAVNKAPFAMTVLGAPLKIA